MNLEPYISETVVTSFIGHGTIHMRVKWLLPNGDVFAYEQKVFIDHLEQQQVKALRKTVLENMRKALSEKASIAA